MGESESQGSNDPLLQSLDDDFQALQRHFADQLAKDIEYLQTEKQRLISDLEALRVEYDQLYIDYQSLRNEADVTLSKRELAQQNAWAKRLARVLAQNLRDDLHAYVTNSVELPTPTQDWLHALDDTLNRSVKALQQDLSSYQSTIAQQLTRMQTMEQQGEVLLANLVERLSNQLGDLQLGQAPTPPGTTLPSALDNRPLGDGSPVVDSRTYIERPRPDQIAGATRRVVPPYGGQTVDPSPVLVNEPKRDRILKKGMVLCGIATFGFSAITVLVGALSLGSNRFGPALTGLDSFNFFNANALLWLQLVVLIPSLAILAPQLYRSLWRDIGQSLRSTPRLFALLGGGVFYFFAQVFLFQAAGTLGPAVAAPLLFAYPLLVVPLLWWLNGDRPNLLRGVVMLAMAMGVVLILRPLSLTSAIAALLSATAFSLYVVTNSLNTRQSHPISAGLVQHGLMGVLSSIILLIRPLVVTQDFTSQFVLGGLGLGLLASISYFFYYTGLRLVGGLRTALVAATTPIVTALLAIMALTNQPTLQMIQWTGIILITLGGITLAADRLSRQ
ncbi:dmt(drug metabolite transporter) superfamily permease [Leptolyngbya sp. Heron Island J]|uniref:EamA family transporter n=1 Tax=Leptolyngbya sp. Heron Island J TaxID=1385935 RepID=UPI0003B9B8A8|nr:EamA family transporter [Leptolyngbya sp. Heron Island J]ESA35229.1 dmt(drug metabolite transporter) superfamily permease [Leptolyngbya sp. Heron Island J]